MFEVPQKSHRRRRLVMDPERPGQFMLVEQDDQPAVVAQKPRPPVQSRPRRHTGVLERLPYMEAGRTFQLPQIHPRRPPEVRISPDVAARRFALHEREEPQPATVFPAAFARPAPQYRTMYPDVERVPEFDEVPVRELLQTRLNRPRAPRTRPGVRPKRTVQRQWPEPDEDVPLSFSPFQPTRAVFPETPDVGYLRRDVTIAAEDTGYPMSFFADEVPTRLEPELPEHLKKEYIDPRALETSQYGLRDELRRKLREIKARRDPLGRWSDWFGEESSDDEY